MGATGWTQSTERRLRQPAGELDPLRFAELVGFLVQRAIRVGRREAPVAAIADNQSSLLQVQQRPFQRRVVAYEYNNNIRGPVNANLDDPAFSIAAQWQFSGFNIAGKYEWLDYD